MPDQRARLSSMIPYGYQRNGCGYCGSRAAGGQTSASFYARSDDMTPEVYQALMDRGWRRSGKTYYKPDLRNACCPHYTIRLDAAEFRPRKSQRKVVNDLQKYIIGQDYKSAAARLAPKTREEKRLRRHHWDLDNIVHEAEYSRLAKLIDPKSGVAVEPAHTLRITLESDAFTEEKYALFENYQRNVHREPQSKISRSGFRSFLCSGLPQQTVGTNGSDTVPTAGALPSSQDSPAPVTSAKDNGDGKRLGSHHMCYRIDDRLVALGVLDLLPNGVSSVYLLYHESVDSWQFGKVSALHEIALAREGRYGYYYMGYYIHSCAKMKYKADYRPMSVLNPLGYDWRAADQDFWASLDEEKFVAFENGRWRQQASSSFATPDGSATADGGDDDADIWTVKMPGLMSMDEIVENMPPHKIQARAGTMEFALSVLVGDEWGRDEMVSSSSIQRPCAEWIACVGSEIAERIPLQLGPYISA